MVVADEGHTGFGRLQETLEFKTDLAWPIVQIRNATYGFLADTSRVIDVTLEVQSKVKGRILSIGKEEDLHRLFSKDPCPGIRKQLRVQYITRGFTGNIRVREKNDTLIAGIDLGYPPLPPADEEL